MDVENEEIIDSTQLKDLIWKDYCDGLSTIDLSKKYDVSRSYCYQVIAVKKGKDGNTEKILMDKITVLEKQLGEKTMEIQRLREEVELYKKLLIKLAD